MSLTREMLFEAGITEKSAVDKLMKAYGSAIENAKTQAKSELEAENSFGIILIFIALKHINEINRLTYCFAIILIYTALKLNECSTKETKRFAIILIYTALKQWMLVLSLKSCFAIILIYTALKHKRT